jgi:hypothetical protein
MRHVKFPKHVINYTIWRFYPILHAVKQKTNSEKTTHFKNTIYDSKQDAG